MIRQLFKPVRPTPALQWTTRGHVDGSCPGIREEKWFNCLELELNAEGVWERSIVCRCTLVSHDCSHEEAEPIWRSWLTMVWPVHEMILRHLCRERSRFLIESQERERERERAEREREKKLSAESIVLATPITTFSLALLFWWCCSKMFVSLPLVVEFFRH